MPTVPTQSLNPIAANQFAAPTVDPLRDVVSPQIEALGAATERVGASVLSMAEQLQDAHNEAMAREQDNLFTREVHQALYDPQNGFMALRQKSAVEARQALVERLAKARAQAGERLGNGVQREMFGRASEGRLQAALGEIDSHTMTQLRAWNIGEAKAGVEAQREAAVLAARGWAFKEPNEGFMKQVEAFKARLANLARLEGVDEKQAKELERQQVSSLHEAVIYNFLNTTNREDGGPKVALDYLKQHRDEIDSERRDNVTNAVLDAQEQEDVVLAGKLAADEAIAKFPGSYKKQRAHLQKGFESRKDGAGVRIFDAALARLEKEEQRREAGTSRWQAASMGLFQEWVNKNPSGTLDEFQVANPNAYLGIRSAGALDRAKRYVNTGQFENEPTAFRESFGLSEDQLRGMSRDQLEVRYKFRLSTEAFNRLEARHTKATDPANQTERQRWYNTMNDAVNDAFLKMHPTAGNLAKADREVLYGKFVEQANERLRRFEGVTGTTADVEAMRRLLDEMGTSQATIPGMWSDSRKPIAAMTPEEFQEAVVVKDGVPYRLRDIPPEEYERAVIKAIQRGYKPTPEMVVDMFYRTPDNVQSGFPASGRLAPPDPEPAEDGPFSLDGVFDESTGF